MKELIKLVTEHIEEDDITVTTIILDDGQELSLNQYELDELKNKLNRKEVYNEYTRIK